MGDTSPSCSSADQKRDREKTASEPAQMGGTILLYLGNASKEGLALESSNSLPAIFVLIAEKEPFLKEIIFFCIKYFAEDKRNIYLFTSIHYMTIARKAW